jgi:hypothetical protein
MKFRMTVLLLAAGLAAAAQAETPYERDQREQLEKAQREGTLSPQVQQRLRWEAEWRQQHPGEPMPNPGQMQKLHSAEIQANIRAGGARMWAQRQADLRREYQMSRANQQRQLDARHITWTPQQWQAWDRQYNVAQKQKADDYLKAREIAGQINEAERQHDEEQKIFRSQH